MRKYDLAEREADGKAMRPSNSYGPFWQPGNMNSEGEEKWHTASRRVIKYEFLRRYWDKNSKVSMRKLYELSGAASCMQFNALKNGIRVAWFGTGPSKVEGWMDETEIVNMIAMQRVAMSELEILQPAWNDAHD